MRVRLIDGEPTYQTVTTYGFTSAPAVVARPNGDLCVIGTWRDSSTGRVELTAFPWYAASGVWTHFAVKGRAMESTPTAALVGSLVGLAARNDKGGLSWTVIDTDRFSQPRAGLTAGLPRRPARHQRWSAGRAAATWSTCAATTTSSIASAKAFS